MWHLERILAMKLAKYLIPAAMTALLMFTARAYAADDVQAALMDMQRASVTPQIVTEFCARQYPLYAKGLRAAFDAWRKKNADLMFEIETRADSLSRQEAGGDQEKYAAQADKDKASMAQYRAAYEASLRRLPTAESEPACAKYGADLMQGVVNVSDLEKMFATQLQMIRQRDPQPRSR